MKKEALVHQEREESPEIQELRVPKVKMDPQVHKVLQVKLDLKAFLDHLE